MKIKEIANKLLNKELNNKVLLIDFKTKEEIEIPLFVLEKIKNKLYEIAIIKNNNIEFFITPNLICFPKSLDDIIIKPGDSLKIINNYSFTGTELDDIYQDYEEEKIIKFVKISYQNINKNKEEIYLSYCLPNNYNETIKNGSNTDSSIKISKKY